jgi:hypothetical protein
MRNRLLCLDESFCDKQQHTYKKPATRQALASYFLSLTMQVAPAGFVLLFF